MLVRNRMDILAKHWLIFASRDLRHDDIGLARPLPGAEEYEPLQGPYDVEFMKYDGPLSVSSACEFRAQVRFRNRSYRPFSSFSGENPDFLSYHWLNARGAMVQSDGLRTPLVRIVLPGETCSAEMKILSPENPGKYILAIDFVQEGKTWFSDAGNPSLRVRVSVKKK